MVIPERLKNKLPSANDDVAFADGSQIAPPRMPFEHGLLAFGALQVESAGRDDQIFGIGIAKVVRRGWRSRIRQGVPAAARRSRSRSAPGPSCPWRKTDRSIPAARRWAGGNARSAARTVSRRCRSRSTTAWPSPPRPECFGDLRMLWKISSMRRRRSATVDALQSRSRHVLNPQVSRRTHRNAIA